MQYVVLLDIDDTELDGDDSIENACRLANGPLGQPIGTTINDGVMRVRPLSEVLPC